MSKDVLIIGGGISGLSVAWWLKKAGLSVTLWEQDKRTGGKIKTTKQEGYTTERAASLLMNFRPDVAAFIKKAELESLKSTRSSHSGNARYLMNNGRLIATPMSAHGLLLSDLWSTQGKLRLFSEIFIKAGGHENETVSEFITRRFGNELLEKAMEPFVAGTLASDPDLANAWSVMPRLTALEQKYGRISLGVMINKLLRRKTAMVNDVFSFKGGMNTLTDTLSNFLGSDIQKSTSLCALEKHNQQWLATAKTPQGDKTIRAKKVILCTPANISARLLSPLDNELSHLLSGIQYTSLTLVHMGFKQQDIHHPLDGTGFLVPRKEGLHISGNLWMSSLFDDRAPKGKQLMTTYLGGARHPEVAQWDETKSINTVFDELGPLLKLKNEPEIVRIDHHAPALPLYHAHYYARCQQIKNCLKQQPGLYLEANYLGGVSVRDRIAYSRTTAMEVIASIKAKQPERKLWQVDQLVPVQA